MKKLFCLLMLLCALIVRVEGANVIGDQIDLTISIIKDNSGDNPQRSPVLAPSASIGGYTFYINSSHPDYVLQLVDANDGETVLFETFVPENVNSVVLPSTFEGEYRIQLIWGYWCFWGYITL